MGRTAARGWAAAALLAALGAVVFLVSATREDSAPTDAGHAAVASPAGGGARSPTTAARRTADAPPADDGPAIEPLEFADGATFTVRGTVKDDAERPIAGAAVSVAPVVLRVGASVKGFDAETGADGAYAFADLDPRTPWFARARKVGFASRGHGSTLVARPGALVATRDFVLSPSRLASIAVVARRPDGRPLRPVDYAIALDAKAKDGSRSVNERRPGRYRVIAIPGDLAPAVSEVKLAGEDVALPMDLVPGVAIEGTLLASDGTPLRRCTVSARDAAIPGDLFEATDSTDADGGFRIEGLRAAEHVLSISGDFGFDGEARVTAPATGVRLTARDAGRATWRLVYPPSATAAERALEVDVWERASSAQRQLVVGWSGDNGSADVKPGQELTLTFDVAGCVREARTLTVRSGETADLGDVTLTAGHVVTGRVVTDAGVGVRGTVTATVGGVPGGSATCDADGWFVFDRLPAGDGHVDVFAAYTGQTRVPFGAAATAPLMIVLRRGAHLAYRDAEPGADVRLTSGGVALSETADASGEGLVVLPPGRWRVESPGREPAEIEIAEDRPVAVRFVRSSE